MHHYQYILFDLDGTLTDPGEGIINSLQFSLKHFGIEGDPGLLATFIGPPLADSFKKHFGFDQKQTELAIKLYRQQFHEEGRFQNYIYPGIAELLARLLKQGKKLAVATTKPTIYARQILEHFKIAHYFEADLIVGSFLDGRRTNKGELIKTLLELLDSREQLKVMVGDRKYDILGAKANGLPSIGVTYGYGTEEELRQAGACKTVASVEALSALLLGSE